MLFNAYHSTHELTSFDSFRPCSTPFDPLFDPVRHMIRFSFDTWIDLVLHFLTVFDPVRPMVRPCSTLFDLWFDSRSTHELTWFYTFWPCSTPFDPWFDPVRPCSTYDLILVRPMNWASLTLFDRVRPRSTHGSTVFDVWLIRFSFDPWIELVLLFPTVFDPVRPMIRPSSTYASILVRPMNWPSLTLFDRVRPRSTHGSTLFEPVRPMIRFSFDPWIELVLLFPTVFDPVRPMIRSYSTYDSILVRPMNWLSLTLFDRVRPRSTPFDPWFDPIRSMIRFSFDPWFDPVRSMLRFSFDPWIDLVLLFPTVFDPVRPIIRPCSTYDSILVRPMNWPCLTLFDRVRPRSTHDSTLLDQSFRWDLSIFVENRTWSKPINWVKSWAKHLNTDIGR